MKTDALIVNIIASKTGLYVGISISVMVFLLALLSVMFYCFCPRTNKLREKYVIDKILGYGTFDEVLEVSKGTEKFVMKRITSLERKYTEPALEEIRRIKNCKPHPRIAKFEDLFTIDVYKFGRLFR